MDLNVAFTFSRWPGLGGHRYPIGFLRRYGCDMGISCDISHTLQSTAANVALRLVES